jgi:hypothetical protein
VAAVGAGRGAGPGGEGGQATIISATGLGYGDPSPGIPGPGTTTMASAPTPRQTDDALARVRILSPMQAIRDPDLNHALAPFRGHPPTGLLCGNPRCTEPFVWCALDPLTARVRFGPKPPGTGGRPGAPAPYDAWDPGEDFGRSIAPPGEPMLRWLFFCPRCDRTLVLSNARMITLIVRALGSGRTEIRPAAE